MKNHVLRPLYVSIVLVALLFIGRAYVVPSDFGIHGHRPDGKNFTYTFYRAGAVDYWKNISVKYKGRQYCAGCHADKMKEYLSSKHSIIQCENCHGPAMWHPNNPPEHKHPMLAINRSRALCLRCHADLGYPHNPRAKIKAIDPQEHNPGQACVDCHNPHKPDLEDM